MPDQETFSFRQRLGCWLHERGKLELVLRAPALARGAGLEWQDLCNRHEQMSRMEGGGRVCEWQDSSLLTVCRMFPRTGGRLLKHVARQHPFIAATRPPPGPVSAIIPVRGTDRAQTLAFVAAAVRNVCSPGSEVLVCEHDSEPRVRRDWPEGIGRVFIPAAPGEAFNKSKALNAGALAARHPILWLHDADVWPPADFVSRSLARMADGEWEAVRPIRFLFLLDETQSRECLQSGSLPGFLDIPKVQQNNPGLSSFVRRETYLKLGGHDERFIGWGWEDLEFLDRLKTRKLHAGSFLPAVHLWHAVPSSKEKLELNRELCHQVLQEPVARRIERCRRQLEGRG